MIPQPKFSILIPTTGRADLAAMSVNSILKQDLQDFEIIIVDSGADERGLSDIIPKDQRISYFNVNQNSKGHPLLPWDFAARKARGEYIMWQDDDNYLLPFSLKLFNDAIEKTRADIITASQFYYYDKYHPRHALKNSLGIIPFTQKKYFVEPMDLAESMLSFSKRGADVPLPRFHSSATMVSKKIIDQAFLKLGFVILTDTPISHSVNLITLALAQTCFVIDLPVSIVGRLGRSMSQIWSTAARARFKREEFKRKESPVTGHTKINAILENYLEVKKLLPEKLASVEVDYARFAELYMQELFYLDADFGMMIKNWQNFFLFIKTLDPEKQKELGKKAKKLMLLAAFVFLSRRLKLHFLKRFTYEKLKGTGNAQANAKKITGNKEFEISLESYKINSVEDLATKLNKIMLQKTNFDMSALNLSVDLPSTK